MEPGFVVGRSPGVKFKRRLDLLGDIGGTRLTGWGPFNWNAEALRCSECGTVLIPGQERG
jgi:hypothetical protein